MTSTAPALTHRSHTELLIWARAIIIQPRERACMGKEMCVLRGLFGWIGRACCLADLTTVEGDVVIENSKVGKRGQ